MRKLSVILVIAALLAWAGCERNFSTPILNQPALTPEQREFDVVWNASLDTLRKYGFNVDVQDARRGVITTTPMLGQYLTEFWRKDAVTTTALWENSVQTIYRTAKVTIKQRDNDKYAVAVEIHIYRSDRKTRTINSTGEAYDMFLTPGRRVDERDLLVNRTAEEDTAAAAANKYLVHLGRDKAFENKLDADITTLAAQKAQQAAATSRPATEPAMKAVSGE